MFGARGKEPNFRPRHGIVILRTIPRGETPGGLKLPTTSKEGNRHIVVAIGPEVEGLKVGDEVVPGGPTLQAEFYPIPGYSDISAIDEKWCMLVVDPDLV